MQRTAYGYENITPEELREKLDNNDDFLLLDVRTPAEHREQAVEGSILLPVQELNFRVDELPKEREIVVYCRVGNRSSLAASYLARLGYNVKNLEGGIVAWDRCGTCAHAMA